MSGKKPIRRERTRTLEKERKERREDPVTKTLYEILIKPLVDMQPAHFEEGAWLSEVIGVDDRPIDHYKSRASFRLPGVLITPSNKENLVPTDLERFIKRDQVVCIRLDKNFPDKIEVEIVDNPRSIKETTRLFRLTGKQWSEVNHNFVPYIAPYRA